MRGRNEQSRAISLLRRKFKLRLVTELLDADQGSRWIVLKQESDPREKHVGYPEGHTPQLDVEFDVWQRRVRLVEMKNMWRDVSGSIQTPISD